MNPDVSKIVNREIHRSDSMFHGVEKQYFDVGESGLDAVLWGLDCAGKSQSSVKLILDYASGYGRVARWLDAHFNEATITAVDADEKSVEALSAILKLRALPADLSMKKRLGGPFDAIWMGSLITHLRESDTIRILKYMKSHLSHNGVFIGTMHGPYVTERIRSKEKTYGLEAGAQSKLLRDYDNSGYGFGEYYHDPNYGIATWSQDKMKEVLKDSGLQFVAYEERLWANHQDVFAATL